MRMQQEQIVREVTAWLGRRLPDGWFTGPPEVTPPGGGVPGIGPRAPGGGGPGVPGGARRAAGAAGGRAGAPLPAQGLLGGRLRPGAAAVHHLEPAGDDAAPAARAPGGGPPDRPRGGPQPQRRPGLVRAAGRNARGRLDPGAALGPGRGQAGPGPGSRSLAGAAAALEPAEEGADTDAGGALGEVAR